MRKWRLFIVMEQKERDYSEYLIYKGTSYKSALKALSTIEKGYLIGTNESENYGLDCEKSAIIRTKNWK